MTPVQNSLRRRADPRQPVRRLATALALASASLLAACGGGGDGTEVAGVGTGGTGSFSAGIVTGFGSVFVNGIRYEDKGARLVDDDGKVLVLGTDDNPLKVGMVVEVAGKVEDDGSTRSATQITYGAEVKGPVTAVDAVAGTFSVFGIAVRSSATTVFDNLGGVAALVVGNVVEVHGQPDTDGSIVATHVEREAASIAAFVAADGEYRLRGEVVGRGGSSPTTTFTVRGVPIRTDAGTDFDGTPVNGAWVSVRLDPTLRGDGRYLAERVKLRAPGFGAIDDAQAEGEVEGYVSGFAGAGSPFQIAGYPARLAAGVEYDDGTAADLKDGIRVEAKGDIESGVLVVTKLEFKSRDDDDDGEDDDVSGGAKQFEFKGTAACTACSANSGSFTIKGVIVRYEADTDFRDGLSGATLDGKAVEVRSIGEVTPSGTVYRATRIDLDD
jgi:Domain of unknown function (DUF5666)